MFCDFLKIDLPCWRLSWLLFQRCNESCHANDDWNLWAMKEVVSDVSALFPIFISCKILVGHASNDSKFWVMDDFGEWWHQHSLSVICTSWSCQICDKIWCDGFNTLVYGNNLYRQNHHFLTGRFLVKSKLRNMFTHLFRNISPKKLQKYQHNGWLEWIGPDWILHIP